jgi:hypothetical protein
LNKKNKKKKNKQILIVCKCQRKAVAVCTKIFSNIFECGLLNENLMVKYLGGHEIGLTSGPSRPCPSALILENRLQNAANFVTVNIF